MIQSGEVFSVLITYWNISHGHKLGVGIAFVISMVILLLPPPPSCPPAPFTYYIPVLFLSPPLFTIFCLPLFIALFAAADPPPSPPPPLPSPSVFLSFLSQPITLSFLPWRQYYQCSTSGKLHPESFLELEIGMVRGWRFSRGKGRACFTHQPAPVSRESSSPSPPLPPASPHVETCCSACLISTPTHSQR